MHRCIVLCYNQASALPASEYEIATVGAVSRRTDISILPSPTKHALMASVTDRHGMKQQKADSHLQ
jgi:hypothetical protein